MAIIANYGEVNRCLAQNDRKNECGKIEPRCRQIFDNISANSGRPVGDLFNLFLTNAENSKLISNAWKEMLKKHGEYHGCRTLVTYRWLGSEAATVVVSFTNDEVLYALFFDKKSKLDGLCYLGPLPTEDVRYISYKNQLKEISVMIGDEPWQLEGVLTLPYCERKERCSGVILIHGSGPSDRDGTIMAQKPFRDIAIGLAVNGIAVLRYDKRTYTYDNTIGKMELTEICPQSIIIDDALAGLEYLKSVEAIDSNSLFLVGASLGGYIAPEIARQYGNVKGLAILAGNSRPLDEVLIWQLETNLKNNERLEFSEKSRIIQEITRLKKLRCGKLPSKYLIMGAPVSFWLELCRIGGPKTAKLLKCPMFIAQGGQDRNIDRLDYEGWKLALRNNDKATFIFYNDLNHLFINGDGAMNITELGVPKHVDPIFIKDLSLWIKNTSVYNYIN